MEIVLGGAGELLGVAGPACNHRYPDPRKLAAHASYVEQCEAAGGGAAELAAVLRRVLAGETESGSASFVRQDGLVVTVTAMDPSGAIVTIEPSEEGPISPAHHLIDDVPVGCIRLDESFRVTYVNRAFETLFGYEAHELLGREPFEFIVAAEYVGFVRELFNLIRKGDMPEGPSLGENVTKGGRRFLSEWTNHTLRNADGSFSGVFSACLDITERTRMQQEIEHGEQRYRSLLETLPDAILVTRGMTLTYVNSAAPALFHASDRSDLLGKPLAELLQPASRHVFAGEGDLMHSSLPQRVQLKTLDNESVTAESVAIPLADAPGAPGMVIVLRDIGLREMLEHELQQKQKLEVVGQLASGIAHDFNNVLSIILAACGLLRSGRVDTDKAREEIEFIREAAESAAALVRQLLAFARRRPSEPKWFDLYDLIESSSALLRRLGGEGVVLTLEPAPTLWKVRADLRQVEQVVVNLVANARAAMPQGGSLRIAMVNVEAPVDVPRVGLDPGRYVELSVADSGHGMDPPTLARIFEPFFTTRSQGVGLGLATSEAIVSQSGGRILADSEPGRGTVFRVYLPAAERPADSDADLAPTVAAAAGEATVLVVDDNLALHSLAARILKQSGYRVLQAPNAATAIEVANRHEQPIDLLLTDVVMPGMSGPELARELIRTRPGLGVLFMSGYADDLLARYGLTLSAESMIQKPFAPRQLLERVAVALSKRRKAAAAYPE